MTTRLSGKAVILAAAVIGAIGVMPVATNAQLMPMVQDKSWPGLTQDDMARITAAEARLYEGRSIGTVERWRSPESKNAGEIKLVRRYETQKMPCTGLAYTVRFAERSNSPYSYTQSWCKTGAGEWKIVSTKPPA